MQSGYSLSIRDTGELKDECDAHENFKNTFIKAKEQDVKIIKRATL